MKPFLFLFISSIFILACNGNDDDIDCSLVDCAFQSISIELVDTDGNNLIANGTYQQSDIVITKDGNQLNSNLDTSDIIFFEIQGKVGSNIYEVKLNENETDILVLTLSGERIKTGCCGPYFQISSISYNGEDKEGELKEENYFQKITVIK